MYAVIGLSIIVIAQFVGYRISQEKQQQRELKQIREIFADWKSDAREWTIERQQLLDRIQAPTFSEYKQQEVKVIKAKNGTDKPDVVIEQL
jgi:hypothetical protein